MAVKMRTGRLTTKTTDPKTGARIADPSVFGKEIMEGTVSSWPEVRKNYQQGKYKGDTQKLPADVKNYLEGKTDKLDDTLYDEPYVGTRESLSGKYSVFGANLKKGSPREVALTKKYQSTFGKLNEGESYKFHMAEDPSSKMGGAYVGTDIDKFRNIKPDPSPKPAELEKIPTRPAKITSSNAKLKEFKGPVAEKTKFVAPGVEQKTKTKTSTSSAMTGGKKGLVKAKGDGNLGSARVTNTDKLYRDKMGYNRQEKLFKAYAGTSVLGESHIGKSSQDINAYKKEMQSQRKAYRKEGNLEGITATGMEVKQARQAEKFVKGPQTHFNTKNREKTKGISSAIALDYRESLDNAANRNTMDAKLKAISSKPKNNTSLY